MASVPRPHTADFFRVGGTLVGNRTTAVYLQTLLLWEHRCDSVVVFIIIITINTELQIDCLLDFIIVLRGFNFVSLMVRAG